MWSNLELSSTQFELGRDLASRLWVEIRTLDRQANQFDPLIGQRCQFGFSLPSAPMQRDSSSRGPRHQIRAVFPRDRLRGGPSERRRVAPGALDKCWTAAIPGRLELIISSHLLYISTLRPRPTGPSGGREKLVGGDGAMAILGPAEVQGDGQWQWQWQWQWNGRRSSWQPVLFAAHKRSVHIVVYTMGTVKASACAGQPARPLPGPVCPVFSSPVQWRATSLRAYLELPSMQCLSGGWVGQNGVQCRSPRRRSFCVQPGLW
jgi:hypothetical protein